jgi:hypothetical protein
MPLAARLCNCLTIKPHINTLCNNLIRHGIGMVKEGYLFTLAIKFDLYEQIKEAQQDNKCMDQSHSKKEGKV